MAIDNVGNTLKEGDLVLFNNLKCIVKKIREGNIVGASKIETVAPGKEKIQGMMIPGELTLELAVSFDPTKTLALFVLKNPDNQDLAKLSAGDN